MGREGEKLDSAPNSARCLIFEWNWALIRDQPKQRRMRPSCLRTNARGQSNPDPPSLGERASPLSMNTQLSPQAAAQHLLNRRRARTDVVEYAGVIEIPGRPLSEDPDTELFTPVETNLRRHDVVILRAMARTAAQRYGRLMIFAPPGSAKTTNASVIFPSYYLGSNPGARLLLTSYGDVPARRMGRKTRSVIQQPRYAKIFNTELSRDSKAAEQFLLTNGSEYLAASLFGSITSFRADGAILDDPVRGREDAAPDSATPEKTWEAYTDSLSSRLVPGGWLVIIQTRWNENDLAGRILPEKWKGDSGFFEGRDGRRWEVVCLQARCETDTDPLGRRRGEYLAPEWFDREHWVQFERLPHTWASLYQQIPAPLEGALFQPDKLQVLDEPPPGVKWVRAYDLAATADDGAFTAGVKMGLWNGKPVVADVRRKQGSPDQVEQLITATAQIDGLTVEVHLPQDPGQAGKFQVSYLTAKLLGFKVRSSPETGDKVTRAGPYASQVNAGNGYLVRGGWNHEFIDELRVFPFGTYKDQVDAASRAFAAIATKPHSFFS